MIVDHKIIQYFMGLSSLLKYTGSINKWKSKWLSEECIATPATLDNSFAPKLTYIHSSKIAVKFQ